MKKKVLVLGATGMLGSMVFRYLSNKSDCTTLGTASNINSKFGTFHVDNSFRDNIKLIISKIKPHYIVNCIGLIRPGDSLDSYRRAILTNSVFPKYLSKICLKNKIRLIHISTDCVFSGKRGSYSEYDIPDEVGIYGVSKYLGETCDTTNITIRTSIVGREGHSHKNLLEWFLTSKNKSVEGYDKVMWNGITTLALSKIIYRIIQKNILFDKPLIQIATKSISKYDLLFLFSKVYNKKILIKKNLSVVSDKTLIPSKEQDLHFRDILLPLELQIIELKKFYD